ncbi:glycosyltransferase involved in cell wall biogenesis [Rhodopirellula maiorica SM1]|uniref:Glycosyltransferase involved in cell wall biogenesis n=1 Tax=Rhodopirellula maiorica SM1 TaxID=1265738 RepID=M5RIB1_9BACT|nr:glycosyltransferase involved in cell wall biogenesis [Rhodopirellula maiorica]EMI19035.1 glycosyltransferase involved in cell wall biogenesis [Rhodopirellula maiorica SM1]
MADFAQNGIIGTLHNLRNRSTEELESELVEYSSETPMSLLLPCLFSELEGPAMGPIVQELAKIPYLSEIIIGLDRANEEQFHAAKRFFDKLPQNYVVLWNDGTRLRHVDAALQAEGIAPNQPGKGRNVWYCLGYFLASGKSKAVALHDCDILTYDRSMPARLLYPLAHPSFHYQFCKGYYYRAADGKLNGRVFRLLVIPLIRALKTVLGRIEYLDYMGSFRYALSGEFSMRSEVVTSLRFPSDWGLEIGTLSEMYRNCNLNRICQVDIADAYDHKHQVVSEDDRMGGLHRMANDICKAFIRKLAVEGIVISGSMLRTLKACYYRTALDVVDHYHNDAVMSGLNLDRHREEATVELFSRVLVAAGDDFLNRPDESPFIHNWSRVTSALPDIYEMLLGAVEADNA